MDKIDAGVRKIQLTRPNIKSPNLSWGLRATRYYIEFPITEGNLDIFGLILSLEQLIQDNAQSAKVTDKTSYKQGDNLSYMVDYKVDSTTAPGGRNKGTFFVRGVQNEAGAAYKFVLEKNTDFHDLDIEIVLRAYEESFKNSQRNTSASPPVMGAGGQQKP